MLMDMYLLKLDIYQDAVAPNYFESHTNFLCPDFFQKKVYTNVRSEIYLVQRNIVSIGQSNQA